MDILLYILIGLTAVLLALVAVLLIRQGRLARGQESDFDRLAEELHRQQTAKRRGTEPAQNGAGRFGGA